MDLVRNALVGAYTSVLYGAPWLAAIVGVYGITHVLRDTFLKFRSNG